MRLSLVFHPSGTEGKEQRLGAHLSHCCALCRAQPDFSKEKLWDVGTNGEMQINVLIAELTSHQPQSWGQAVEGLILGEAAGL